MRRETSNTEETVRFRPSRVEGVADVDEVFVAGDALELVAGGKRLTFPLLDFARGREISSGRVPVGEMYFSKSSYSDSRLVFYGRPRIVIFMPADGPTTYPHSHFWRVQEVLRDGGFKLYADGPPKMRPRVLDPHPGRTIVYAVAALALSWLYALAGFLPEPAGGAWREFLLWNPRNPSISLGFTLPATVLPLILAFRHGKTMRTLAGIIVTSYIVALISEWALRHVVHSWAAVEAPPFNMPFWSAHRFGTLLITVIVAALIGWSWRLAFLEPISRSTPAHGEPAAA